MAVLVPETGSGLTTANSLGSLSEFTKYFENRGDDPAEWGSYADEDFIGGLLYATRDTDQSFEWLGVKTTTTQALGWPRIGATDKEGQLIESNVIIDVLKEAVFERAKDHLLVRAVNASIDPEAMLKSLKIGPVELDWDRAKSQMPDNSFYLVLLRGLYVGSAVSFEVVRA